RLAGAVERVGLGAQPDRAGVRLALQQQIARDLGGLADAERQQAAGERIERAEVTDLRRPEPPLQPADGAGGRQPLRLVDEEDAGHDSPSPSLPGPRRPSSSSESTRRARSGVVSYSKRSSGVTRIPRLRPNPLRRNGVARASAFCVSRGVASTVSVRK